MQRNLIFTLFFSVLFSFQTFAQNLDGIAAVVNDSVITQNELNDGIAKAKQQIAANPNSPAIDNDKLKKMVLQQLIDEKLQLELAKRANITITDKQVNDAIAHIAEGNHLTVDQLKQALTQEGMNFDDYRKMIRKQLLIHQVEQSAVGSQVHVTPEAIKAAKNELQSHAQAQGQQYHVIDAVFTSKSAAQDALVKIKNGGSPGDDANDLGWQTLNTLPTVFVDQLKNMKTGDVAGPIEAPNGFHVIKLAGVRGSASGDNKKQLENIAYQMQFQKAVEKWLVELRKTAYVKVVGE